MNRTPWLLGTLTAALIVGCEGRRAGETTGERGTTGAMDTATMPGRTMDTAGMDTARAGARTGTDTAR